MKAKQIDGKSIAQSRREGIALQAAAFLKKQGRAPGLAVIIAGDDAASHVYVKNKILACEATGIASFAHHLSKDITEKEMLALIDTLNNDTTVDGILVQLPLPSHLDDKKILKTIAVEKDVDGFSAAQVGNLVLGNDGLVACTPKGCVELIDSTGVSIEGKHAVVVGRSNIVGKPVALLLLERNATVTVCHSKTQDLKSHLKNADIVVAAVGIKEFIKGDMLKKDCIVIDVGINRFEGKLYGDVEFESCANVASHITPVPGGVGPMTITMLLANTLKAAQEH